MFGAKSPLSRAAARARASMSGGQPVAGVTDDLERLEHRLDEGAGPRSDLDEPGRRGEVHAGFLRTRAARERPGSGRRPSITRTGFRSTASRSVEPALAAARRAIRSCSGASGGGGRPRGRARTRATRVSSSISAASVAPSGTGRTLASSSASTACRRSRRAARARRGPSARRRPPTSTPGPAIGTTRTPRKSAPRVAATVWSSVNAARTAAGPSTSSRTPPTSDLWRMAAETSLTATGPRLGGGEGDGVLGRAGPAPRSDGDAEALEPGPGLGLEEGLAAFGPGGRGMRRQRRLRRPGAAPAAGAGSRTRPRSTSARYAAAATSSDSKSGTPASRSASNAVRRWSA